MSLRQRSPGGFTAAFAGLACILAPLSTAYGLSPGRERTTFASPHFEITVDSRKGGAVAEAAAWLEAAYRRQSAFFEFELESKTQVLLLDEEDYSNGFAYAANQWVALYMPPARMALRGLSQWLPEVASHELAHVITLRKMGVTRKFLGIEALFERQARRTTFGVDAAWLTDDVPPWLAEGLAQYGSMACGLDTLDSHRTMLLREAWLSYSLLPLKALEAYARDARSSEMIYNQGFHLVDFLYRRHGPKAVNRMLQSWSAKGYRGSFLHAFGATPEAIYAAWVDEVGKRFGIGLSGEGHGRPRSDRDRPYRYQVDPVPDSLRGRLFYLDSDPNDFGLTHLFRRDAGGKISLVMRDVNPPLHGTADGDLLFTSTRIMPSTGARISDLYRYAAKGDCVTRLTYGLRAIAGTQTPKGEVFAILQEAGKTRIAWIMDGKARRWVEAPDRAEFADIQAANDSLLDVTVVRGNNADIYTLETRHGALTPLLASTRNERDPMRGRGRLFFSADFEGSYAIYSLNADSLLTAPLRKHTAGGPSAFSPALHGDTLYHTAYGERGFSVQKTALTAGSLTSVRQDSAGTETSALKANAPYGQPPGTELRPLNHDRIRIESIGHYASLGYAHLMPVTLKLGDAATPIQRIRANSCADLALAGGGTLWSDIDQRHSFSMSALGAHCLADDEAVGTYLPAASLEIVNRDFVPDLFLTGQFQSAPLRGFFGDREIVGDMKLYQATMGMMFHLAHGVDDLTLAQYQGLQLDWNENRLNRLSGSGGAFGNLVGFQFLDPGMDFINRGVAGSGGLLVFPAGSRTQWMGLGNIGLYGHISRTLFVQAAGGASQFFGHVEQSTVTASGACDLRMPLHWTVGSSQWRGLFMESLFLHVGYAGQWNRGDEALSADEALHRYAGLSHSIPASRWQGFRSARPQSVSASTFTPSFVEGWSAADIIDLSLRIKMIAPSSRLVFWSFGWSAPVERFSEGRMHLSLSL